MLAIAAFVLALTVGAALRTQADPVPTASAANAVKSGTPAVNQVTETASNTRRAALSAVPELPALHGVKEPKRKPKRKKAPAAPARRSAPAAPVTRAPASTSTPVAPARPVAPSRPVTPSRPAAPPQKKSPSFVGKGFDSSG
ncbi:hypothetical protein [Solirubrobacter deserti]|uniref:Uncharacterized protein n=1 Tax=Solirubrobacter deserti TaxID=2282478 RepID=A0ABT4RHV2_9ACTN|nr:hypothetical protein [Solirubrobacter deserti]MDA0138134.1 hypothetical protein [Solirubrobacter deserti]